MSYEYKSGTQLLEERYVTFDEVGLNAPDRRAGSLWSWGQGFHGILGLGDLIHRSSPVQVGSLTNWQQVSCQGNTSAAVRSDGTLWTWGYDNELGKLGLGSPTPLKVSSPVQVGSLTNWSNVCVSDYGVYAIKTDNTLWAWGYGQNGNLGVGSTFFYSSPVQVGSLTNWKSVSSRRNHTVAVKTDGTLWAWGNNDHGQLGLGDRTHRSSPTQVGSLSTWKQAVSSHRNIIAVKTDGTLWSWGDSLHGVSTGTDAPIQVGTQTNWKLVNAGSYQAFAVKTDGTIWSWGTNFDGALGLNSSSTVTISTPTQVGTLSNWKNVTGNQNRVVALKTDGTLWAWGSNSLGELGVGDRTHRSSPVQVGSLTSWKDIATAQQSHAISFQ